MVEKAAMYVVVALGAYGVQLNIGSEYFSITDLGITGSFSAIFKSYSEAYPKF